MNKFKFIKEGEDTYRVFANEVEIGKLTKSWHRLGGIGWAIPGSSTQLGNTRQKAALKLLKINRK